MYIYIYTYMHICVNTSLLLRSVSDLDPHILLCWSLQRGAPVKQGLVEQYLQVTGQEFPDSSTSWALNPHITLW